MGQREDAWHSSRQQMVEDVLIRGGIQNPRVIEAMRNTPRHEFVPRHVRQLAYQDMALPIGDQQTISSPFIVAFMTECIDPQPTDRVLEIGTGSGYQAAVLSPLGPRSVFDRDRRLARSTSGTHASTHCDAGMSPCASETDLPVGQKRLLSTRSS